MLNTKVLIAECFYPVAYELLEHGRNFALVKVIIFWVFQLFPILQYFCTLLDSSYCSYSIIFPSH